MAIISGNANTDDNLIGNDTEGGIIPVGDVIYGFGGNDTLEGLKGNDILDGGRDQDLLKGGYGDDDLYGDLGNDTIYGGEGDDTLTGVNVVFSDGDHLDEIEKLEYDTLTGGVGADVFVLGDSVGETEYWFYKDKGCAIITDFNSTEGDKFQAIGDRLDYTVGVSDVIGETEQDTIIAYKGDTIAVLQDYSGGITTQDFVFI
jgi:Ca2+-binding RTX toxin-like protein